MRTAATRRCAPSCCGTACCRTERTSDRPDHCSRCAIRCDAKAHWRRHWPITNTAWPYNAAWPTPRRKKLRHGTTVSDDPLGLEDYVPFGQVALTDEQRWPGLSAAG